MPTPLQQAQTYCPIFHFHPNEGRQCCFPSDAEIAYPRARAGRTGEHRTPTTIDHASPCYFQYWHDEHRSLERVKFWLWYNFNDFPQGPDFLGSHPGDWEHIEVLLREGVVVGYYLSNHEAARLLAPNSAQRQGLRLRVWVANGSHAHYPNYHSPDLYCRLGFCDEVAAHGNTLDPVGHLRNVDDTNFGRDQFGGDWGDGKRIFGPPHRSLFENPFP